MSRLPSRIWTSYLNLLNRYPMRVQIVQTGVLMATGDVIAQKLFEKREIEWSRTLRFALIGSTFVGPAVRIWYLSLEKMVGAKVTVGATLSKVFMDQVGFSPIMHASILTYIGLLQKQRLAEIKATIEEKWVDIIFTGWKIWPAAQIINFYLVPFLLRPLVVNIVALIWNTYLAWKANANELQ